jgi:hypothetical protein
MQYEAFQRIRRWKFFLETLVYLQIAKLKFYADCWSVVYKSISVCANENTQWAFGLWNVP